MDSAQALQRLAALSQETRLALFRTLIVAGTDGLPAGELARGLGVAAPTLSFHLHQLETAGLLGSRRFGRQIRYAVELSAMRELLAFLMEDCCQGRPEICADLLPAARGAAPARETAAERARPARQPRGEQRR